ncbi:dTDP-4-dehydrorhamnose 3,5-epimerase [Segetibacter koreensis]|uniref:dTDP-4-dehydrorhamnose 3,5-epimerase n=1 Tax=Segetibacter koreensis TaxID=398037 RepID=UPI00037D19E9|nr:dTDP-4-dehydrorhamnose 3,5-epimerase [Segetibacter koreensis]
MRAEKTPLKDCFLIHDSIHYDERGHFFESFNAQKFYRETGANTPFVQDNQSHSVRGVLRGIHFQKGEFAQAKLVRVLKGEVLDVAVDLRRSSPTFGQHYAVVLSETSHTQLYIPRGFGHGFLVLSDVVDFFYKCDNFYNKEAEGGIIYNDPEININWLMQPNDLIISSKDISLPLLSSYATLF